MCFSRNLSGISLLESQPDLKLSQSRELTFVLVVAACIFFKDKLNQQEEEEKFSGEEIKLLFKYGNKKFEQLQSQICCKVENLETFEQGRDLKFLNRTNFLLLKHDTSY